ncbi:hypothetical protein H9P43_005722 [Blastocladiella emersonii ATCC 22665]|nr:hypothetical protein H9P43_005722 [Blastocladiella emersonii ATCC 22665]
MHDTAPRRVLTMQTLGSLDRIHGVIMQCAAVCPVVNGFSLVALEIKMAITGDVADIAVHKDAQHQWGVFGAMTTTDAALGLLKSSPNTQHAVVALAAEQYQRFSPPGGGVLAGWIVSPDPDPRPLKRQRRPRVSHACQSCQRRKTNWHLGARLSVRALQREAALFPTRSIMRRLVGTYFATIHCGGPFVDRRSVERDLALDMPYFTTRTYAMMACGAMQIEVANRIVPSTGGLVLSRIFAERAKAGLLRSDTARTHLLEGVQAGIWRG